MIEVRITHDGEEIGLIQIERVGDRLGGDADYSIKFGVERIASVGTHRRAMLAFPRRQYNVLALLRQALNTLEPDELKLEGDPDVPFKRSRFRRLL